MTHNTASNKAQTSKSNKYRGPKKNIKKIKHAAHTHTHTHTKQQHTFKIKGEKNIKTNMPDPLLIWLIPLQTSPKLLPLTQPPGINKGTLQPRNNCDLHLVLVMYCNVSVVVEPEIYCTSCTLPVFTLTA